MSVSSLGGLLVLAVALGGTAAARTQSEGVPGPPAGLHEVDVVAVMFDERAQQPVVVMESRRDKRTLSMAIGVAEATGIAVPLRGVTPPRPLTHDLFLTLFGRLNVSLKQVVITDFRDDVYYALVYLSAGGTDMTLDARPSDAIALALRAKVRVFVEQRVLDRMGGPLLSPRPQI
jgi:bifunctional DNase/RNase